MRNVVGESFSGTDFKGKTGKSSRRQVSLKKIFETQIWLPVCLFVSLPVSLHACLPACLSVCLSVCFSVSFCQSGFVLLCLLASLPNSVFLSPWFVCFWDFFSLIFFIVTRFLLCRCSVRFWFHFYGQFQLVCWYYVVFSISLIKYLVFFCLNFFCFLLFCWFYIDIFAMEVSKHHSSNKSNTPCLVWLLHFFQKITNLLFKGSVIST